MNHPHHHDHSGHHHEDKPPRQFHKDWRVWVVVVVILAAMATYVLTNGEVLRFAPPPPESAPVTPASK
ncbi:MAG TPA: hypothetical protein VG055_03705 [Planctomycetaceae bacterium]|jgi:hypothetical protein|nr:hypothetical protein [Planctomycetaceae bacterium]